MVVFYNMTESEVKSYTNFHLSIEFSELQISLLLTDKASSKAIAIEHILLGENPNLRDKLQDSEITSKSSPASVSCVVINSLFTLVPNSIFIEDNTSVYLKTLVNLPKELSSMVDKHTSREITTCFGCPNPIKEAVLQLFPNAGFKHISSVLSNSIQNGFHINFSGKSNFEITVIKEKKLLFFNRFTFENIDESFYFITLVTEKLKLNLTETKISISGNVNKNEDILTFWKQFIPKENLIFNEVETTQLNAVSTHQYFTLHKQFSCV